MSRGAEEVRFILELGDKKSFHTNLKFEASLEYRYFQ